MYDCVCAQDLRVTACVHGICVTLTGDLCGVVTGCASGSLHGVWKLDCVVPVCQRVTCGALWGEVVSVWMGDCGVKLGDARG